MRKSHTTALFFFLNYFVVIVIKALGALFCGPELRRLSSVFPKQRVCFVVLCCELAGSVRWGHRLLVLPVLRLIETENQEIHPSTQASHPEGCGGGRHVYSHSHCFLLVHPHN